MLYNNAIRIGLQIGGGYMNDEQRIQFAVEEFERIGHAYPRRWSARFGAIKLSDFDAPSRLKSSYSAARRQVEACIPKQDGEQVVTYALRL